MTKEQYKTTETKREDARQWRESHREPSRKYAKEYYRANRELFLQKQRVHHLRSTYGMTVEDFENRLSEQDSKCAICFATEPGGRGTWHIDHDHSCCPGRKSCGKCVRGLICYQCNQKLSVIENRAWMQKAQDYLRNSSGKAWL